MPAHFNMGKSLLSLSGLSWCAALLSLLWLLLGPVENSWELNPRTGVLPLHQRMWSSAAQLSAVRLLSHYPRSREEKSGSRRKNAGHMRWSAGVATGSGLGWVSGGQDELWTSLPGQAQPFLELPAPGTMTDFLWLESAHSRRAQPLLGKCLSEFPRNLAIGARALNLPNLPCTPVSRCLRGCGWKFSSIGSRWAEIF